MMQNAKTALAILFALSFVTIPVSAGFSRRGPAKAGPYEASAAQATSCAADAKVANLNFTLKDIDGKNVALSSFKGNVIVLDFWATWCPPCRKEIPEFIALYNSYKARGLVVVGISMDDEIGDVKPFARKLKMNYPVLIGTGRDDLEQAFGKVVLPTAFVIARDGRICAQHTGFAPKETFEAEIKPLF